MRDDNDYQSFPHAEGSFNLWNWRGLQPDGSLPYARSWNAGRYFPQLKGELDVLEKLPEQQVKQWLSKIATAVADEQSSAE